MNDDIILIPLVCLFVIGISLNMLFKAYLKKQSSAIWEQLGSPSFFTNNTFKNGLKFYKFLWKKEYLKLDNAKLHSFAKIVRFFNIVYASYFVGIILFSIIFTIIK